MLFWSLLLYIDPGSGAILLQALLALLLTFGVFFRRVLFAPFRYFFGRREGEPLSTESVPEGGSSAIDAGAE